MSSVKGQGQEAETLQSSSLNENALSTTLLFHLCFTLPQVKTRSGFRQVQAREAGRRRAWEAPELRELRRQPQLVIAIFAAASCGWTIGSSTYPSKRAFLFISPRNWRPVPDAGVTTKRWKPSSCGSCRRWLKQWTMLVPRTIK